MHWIIVDTSSILFSLSNRKDPFAAITEGFPGGAIMLSKGVLRELEKLASGSGIHARHARAAIALLTRYDNIKVAEDSSYVDGWILSQAAKLGAKVCTNDVRLKRRLKGASVDAFSISKSGMIR